MFKMWIEIVLFLLLGICAVIDGIKREIPVAIVWLGIIMAGILRLQGTIDGEGFLMAVLSVLPGAAFWLISFVTREKVGYGDGWALIMIGLFVGMWRCFLILLIGLVTESVIVLILLAIQRISRDCRIPFVPFLLFGTGVALCL